MAHPDLAKAIELVGLTAMAKDLGLTHQAIRKWEAQGRLPRTEWSGDTDYAGRIARLVKSRGGAVKRADLLRRYESDVSSPLDPANGAAQAGGHEQTGTAPETQPDPAGSPGPRPARSLTSRRGSNLGAAGEGVPAGPAQAVAGA